MYPKTNLQPGQTGQEVAQLQQFLLSQGLMTQGQIDTGPGIYGPRTKAAVSKWQQQNGVDNTSGPGYWGPRSIAVASGEVTGPETQESIDAQYMEAAGNNPTLAALANNGDTIEDIFYALQSGDMSGITDAQGMPFSPEAQQEAMDQAMQDSKLYYEALEAKDTADIESSLAQKQADYQNYLLNSGQSFEEDKEKADKSAADKGVLFSGSRLQKEKKMEQSYNQDQSYNRDNMSRDIASTARDFQYKYGNKPTNALNEYYKLGGNTFNANTARGGVGSTSLSKVYNPNKYDFQGTVNTERSANASQRAAGKLWNKGNKLLSTGYNNQY